MHDVLLEDLSTLNKTALEFLDRDAPKALSALQQALRTWNTARPTHSLFHANSQTLPLLVAEYLTSVNLLASMMIEDEGYADVPTLLLQAIGYADEFTLPEHRAESLRLMGVYHIMHGEQRSAEEYFTRAAESYAECGNPIGKAKVVANIGNVALLRGEYEKAIERFLEVMAIVEHHNHAGLIIGTHKSLGDAYLDTGDYAHALEHYMQALSLAEHRGELQGNSNILDGLGNLYEVIGDYDTALEWYRRAFALIEESGNIYALAGILHNIGTLHKYRGEYPFAQGYLRQAEERFRAVNDDNGIAHCLVNRAEVEVHLGNLSEGYECARMGLELATRVHAQRMMAGAYAALGSIAALAIEQGVDSPVSVAQAQEYLTQALALAQQNAMHETEMQVHSVMAHFYTATAAFQKALEHTQLHYKLEKEILTRYNKHRLEVVQMQMNIRAQRNENELLRGKNHELGLALENVRRLNVHLQHMNDEKNEFLGIASHDLKNPLSIIRMEAEYIIKHHAALPHPELLHYMQNIRESAIRMFALLEELLNVNAIEQGTMHSKQQPCMVGEIAQVVIAKMLSAAEAKNIRIHYDCSNNLIALCDEAHLYQVMENLLSNALKFSPRGSEVWLSGSRIQNKVQICVQDQGAGLTQEDHAKLFRKFQKLSARPTGGEHSTGLGLSIVKKLVDMMGGTVRCESEAGKGAAFIVELPLAPGEG